MKTIHKFPLQIEDEQEIEMPPGSQPLSVGVQGAPADPTLVVWAMVDTNATRVGVPMGTTFRRRFYIRGTGHPLRPEMEAQFFIGTAAWPGGLIWHVFDGGEHYG
jgi:hypothetical protein